MNFGAKIAVQILYHHFYYQYVSLFLLYQETYFSKHTEAFERKIQPDEMVKSLCEKVVVL